jgi:hypothetical protein
VKTKDTPLPTKPYPTSSATSLSPTLTPTIPFNRALEIPIGRNTQLIIHRVQDGESLDLIARKFATTIEAIRAVNYIMPSPILVNSLVIVPFEMTDVSNLAAFEAYQIQADISVEALAKQLNSDPYFLNQYNQFSDGEILRVGDWILVPHRK